MGRIKRIKPYRIILRVEIDTLFDKKGKLSLKKMEHLAMVCTNLQNAGFKVLIVTSGAIMLGTEVMGLDAPPTDLIKKMAIASIGQAHLIKHYQMMFNTFDQTVAQVLVTRDVIQNPVRKKNAQRTLNKLLEKGIIPVINENDAISTDDIILNNNYPLTLIVAALTLPNAIIIHNDYDESQKFTLLVRNHPVMLRMSESELFSTAMEAREGKSLAELTGFNCSTKEKTPDSHIHSPYKFVNLEPDTPINYGFPEFINFS